MRFEVTASDEVAVIVTDSELWTLINGMNAAANSIHEAMDLVTKEDPDNPANEPFIVALRQSADRYRAAARELEEAPL